MVDPVWKASSEYSVIKNPQAKQNMYLRTDDSVVKFIVDMGDSTERNYIYYFPTGLQWDKTVTGVWDFNMKYGDCPANQG